MDVLFTSNKCLVLLELFGAKFSVPRSVLNKQRFNKRSPVRQSSLNFSHQHTSLFIMDASALMIGRIKEKMNK